MFEIYLYLRAKDKDIFNIFNKEDKDIFNISIEATHKNEQIIFDRFCSDRTGTDQSDMTVRRKLYSMNNIATIL